MQDTLFGGPPAKRPRGVQPAPPLAEEMQDPDTETRAELARVIRGTAAAGQDAFITIANTAEGSAPLSVRALARAIVEG